MAEYTELIKRLRLLQYHYSDGDAGDAADAIEAQAKRIAELETALKDAMEELRHAYIMGFTERYRDAARAALKVLGEKE